ncbi:MAG: hypothetical protein ACQEQY_10630 [Halobacteriota archaeon]
MHRDDGSAPNRRGTETRTGNTRGTARGDGAKRNGRGGGGRDGSARDGDSGGSRRRRGGGGRGREGRGRRRNDRGQYVDAVTEQEILALFEETPGPVLTTSDLAEVYDMTTEGARRKLNDLCDAGILDRRKTGRTRVYWRIDDRATA